MDKRREAKMDGGAVHRHEKYGRFVPTGKCHHLHAGHCSFPLDYVLSLVLLTVSIIVAIVIIIIIANICIHIHIDIIIIIITPVLFT